MRVRMSRGDGRAVERSALVPNAYSPIDDSMGSWKGRILPEPEPASEVPDVSGRTGKTLRERLAELSEEHTGDLVHDEEPRIDLRNVETPRAPSEPRGIIGEGLGR
jgi:hypothetical protein